MDKLLFELKNHGLDSMDLNYSGHEFWCETLNTVDCSVCRYFSNRDLSATPYSVLRGSTLSTPVKPTACPRVMIPGI